MNNETDSFTDLNSETSSFTDLNSETSSIISPSSLINENTNILKRPGPKKKQVWNHFDLFGTSNSGHQGCKCKYCGWTQKKGKPSIMETHLAINCQKVSKEIKNTYLHIVSNWDQMDSMQPSSLSLSSSSLPSSSSSSSLNKRQKINSNNQIDKFFRPTNISYETKKLANQAMIKMFVCCGIPFAVANHPYFRDYSRILHPGYIPPLRTELSQNLLSGELVRVLLNVEKELQHEENLTLGK
jgi:hypothetical protein